MSWGEPVEISLYGPGKYQTVTNTAMATECLIEHWPDDAMQGQPYSRALVACLNDLEGKPSEARCEFVRAARDAGMDVRQAVDTD